MQMYSLFSAVWYRVVVIELPVVPRPLGPQAELVNQRSVIWITPYPVHR